MDEASAILGRNEVRLLKARVAFEKAAKQLKRESYALAEQRSGDGTKVPRILPRDAVLDAGKKLDEARAHKRIAELGLAKAKDTFRDIVKEYKHVMQASDDDSDSD